MIRKISIILCSVIFAFTLFTIVVGVYLDEITFNYKKLVKTEETEKFTVGEVAVDVDLTEAKSAPLKVITVNIEEPAQQKTETKILYSESKDFKNAKFVTAALKSGKNVVYFPKGAKANHLRFDFSSIKSSDVKIDSITVNDLTLISSKIFSSYFILLLILIVICLLLKHKHKTKMSYQAFLSHSLSKKASLLADKTWFVFLSGSILGAIIFLKIFGANVLQVTYTDWLMTGGDLTQHYLGWEFFRNSPWNFPIGLIEGLTYPTKVSVMYMDAMPLFAIFFKIFNPILPNNFQYIGIFGLICYILQGGFASIIVKKLSSRYFFSIIGSVFYILSTTMLWRIYAHTALASHWIILACIYICLRRHELKSLKANIIIWCVILSVSVLTHVYFVPMVTIFLVFYLLDRFLDNKSFIESGIIFASSLISLFLVMFLLGAFHDISSPSAGGLGYYNGNINALINPRGQSLYLNSIPVIVGSYEGFAYLGLGAILCFITSIFALIESWFNTKSHGGGSLQNVIKNIPSKRGIRVGLALVSSFLVFALSPTVTFNDKVLFTYNVPRLVYSVWSIFRATGRFLWPVMYIIFTFSLFVLASKYSRKTAMVILIFCILLQYSDLSVYIAQKGSRFIKKTEWKSSMNSEIWDYLAENCNHIIFLNGLPENHYDLGKYAVNNKMTLNDFYIARKNSVGIKQHVTDELDNIRANKADEETIYFFRAADVFFTENLNIYQVDSFFIGLKEEINEPERYEGLKKIVKGIPVDILPKNKLYLKNGTDDASGRTLNKDGVSFGSYMTLTAGRYEIAFEGDNLDKGRFDAVTKGTEIKLNDLEVNPKLVKYYIELEETTDSVEFGCFNSSDANIKIKSLKLTKR